MSVLRVGTYNVYVGADLSTLFGTSPEELPAAAARVLAELAATSFAERARAIARIVIDEQLDLVGLQELAVWARGGVVLTDFGTELLSALEERDAHYELRAVAESFAGSGPTPTGERMSVTGHNAVLVRRAGPQITDDRTGSFDSVLRVETAMGELSIERSWGLVDVRAGRRSLRFANTHLEAYDSDVRASQLRGALDVLRGGPGPVVLVGDLNAEPGDLHLEESYLDAWVAAGGDPDGGKTFGQAAGLRNPLRPLRSRIDQMWVRGARVVSCRVVGDKEEDRTASGLWPSDHACVVATLDLG